MQEKGWRNALRSALIREGLQGQREQELFLGRCELLDMPKESIFLKRGATSRRLGFVIDGALISSHQNENLDPEIDAIYLKHDWVLDHQSFVGQVPCVNQIITVEKTKVAYLELDCLHELVGQSQRFLVLGKILMEGHKPFLAYHSKMPPSEKYAQILAHRPELLRKFPLKAIASYLEIAPETLSRVRRQLMERDTS